MKFLTKILDNSLIWRIFRKGIDLVFGLYRKRIQVIRDFGITKDMSVIDIACGTGQYSRITDADYLGVELNNKYVEAANKTYGTEKRRFICADANTAVIKDSAYNVAILIDATHHLSDPENKNLLATLNRVASRSIVVCDPIKQSPSNLIGRFLTSLDRGNYIRPKNELLDLIGSVLTIEKVVDKKMMGTETICVLAKPKK